MDLGGELRKARQARTRSIDEVSRATKISPTVLRAIEQSAFDTIPRGVFTRGYLRAYAREVGVDPEAVVQRYRDEFEPAAPTREASGEPNTPDVMTEPAVDFGDESAGTRQSRMLQVAVILVVAVAYLASLRTPKPAADAAPPPITAAAVVPDAAEVPVGTSGSTKTPAHLAILIQPHGPCWVDATVDGEHTVARLMKAGDRESIAVRESVTLRVGDPAAFSFTIDGVPGRPLGHEGHPITVQITRENHASFLARPQEPATR